EARRPEPLRFGPASNAQRCLTLSAQRQRCYFAAEAALAAGAAFLALVCLRAFLGERLWVLALALALCLALAGFAPALGAALADAAGAVAVLDDDVCANETAATPEISMATSRLLSLDIEWTHRTGTDDSLGFLEQARHLPGLETQRIRLARR
ncbi:MAG TPA: hypothetical protein VKD22_12020, partial [Ramlibacter sp.]|nr:hypothetical protein [Ramlibacter sp.]